MSTAPSTPPPTTVSFSTTTPNTTPGTNGSPSSSPKPKEKWTTRVGTLVKRRSSRRSSLSLSNNNTPGDVSDSASEKEKVSLVDNLVRKASRRLSFSRSSTSDSIPANPKKKPSIDLQRSVTVDVDLPTTTSTSSLSLEPAHQINGSGKSASSALLAVDVPSPIAESPLREADAVMRDTIAAAEGGRAAGGRFVSMSSIKPEVEIAPVIPNGVTAEQEEEDEKKGMEENIPAVFVEVPVIVVEPLEPVTPPAIPIPPTVPYVAPVEEETENFQSLDSGVADQDLEESMVIVNHPVEEDEVSPEPTPAPVEEVIPEPVAEPVRVEIPVPEPEKALPSPVATKEQLVSQLESNIPHSDIPGPSSSLVTPALPTFSNDPDVAEKSAPLPKLSPNISRTRTPSPSPTSAPRSWSAVKIGTSIVAASLGIALGAYALVRTGVIPSSSLPWFGTSASTSAPSAVASSSNLGLAHWIPDFSFLAAFPFSLSMGWSSSSTPAEVGERGWGAEGMAIAADAATLVVDAAVDSVSGGAVGNMGSGMSTGGAVAGTGVLAVVGAGLAKFGSMFWAPWRAQRRGA